MQKCANKSPLQQRHQRIALSVGAAGAGWILLGLFAHLLGFQVLAFAALGLASLSFTTFLSLIIYSTRRFHTKGHLDHTRHSIEEELRSRRDKQRERMEDW